jgi:hypothetical protein
MDHRRRRPARDVSNDSVAVALRLRDAESQRTNENAKDKRGNPTLRGSIHKVSPWFFDYASDQRTMDVSAGTRVVTCPAA